MNSSHRNPNHRSIHQKETSSFNLEKAYNTSWPYGILKDLKDLGLQGKFPILTKLPRRLDLSNINKQYILGSKTTRIGVPEGSILSVILFMIKIDKITTCLPTKYNGSLYVNASFITAPKIWLL